MQSKTMHGSMRADDYTARIQEPLIETFFGMRAVYRAASFARTSKI
jgi:hypothetical protein